MQTGLLAVQQGGVLGLLLDKGLHERALRDHFQAVGAYLVQRAPDQFRANSLAAEFRRHFGMDEGDHAVGELVIGRGDVAVDREFVAVMRLVVDDFTHGLSPQLFRDSASMPRIDHGSPSLAPEISSIFHRSSSRTKW